MKEQHKIEIKPFNRTVTLLDLPKTKKELNVSIHIHYLRETYEDEDTSTDQVGKVTGYNLKPHRVGGNKEAPKEHEIHLCFVGEKNHLVLIPDHQKNFTVGILSLIFLSLSTT